MVEFKIVHGRIGTDIWANSRLKMVEDLIEAEGKRILDLGCGPGYMGSLFSKDNNVFFVDVEREELKKNDGMRALVDARRPPFRNGTFDYIICAGVLEHIVEAGDVVKNIHSLLKKGGRAIITLPAYSSLYGKHDEYIGHHRRYDRHEFIKLARSNGLKTEYVRYTNSIMFPAFLVSNLLLSQTRTYRGRDRHLKKLVPFLNLICKIEKKVKSPFGIGLLFVLRK